MLNRLRFLALYFLFWIACFEGGRVLFLLYEWRNTVRLDAALIAGILAHGLTMDISLVCAVMIVPLGVVCRAGYLPPRSARRIIGGYTIGVLAIWGLATVADVEIFSVWGYRLDASPLHYLASTREALASMAGSPLLLLGLLLISVIAISAVLFARGLLPHLDDSPYGQLKSVALLAMVTPALTVGVRGGLDWLVPITPGAVYFSRDNFANQAAINPVWSFFESVITGSGEGAVERFTTDRDAQATVDSLLAEPPVHGVDSSPRLLRKRPTRLVILFWESFTAKIAEPLGGLRGVTPGFTRLSKEGILFDQFYAAGPRTTNGLVAALTGLPSHSRTNPLKSAELGESLPRLSVSMSNAGYRTAFYYGARLSFDSRNRFLLSGHYDDIVERKDFDSRDWQSPWGVHDAVVLGRLFGALNSATTPLFAVTLTLSSHAPYKVPGTVVIRGSLPEQRFLNAQTYTDRAVYEFIERAKREPWWDSTLIIILADHGFPFPRTGSPLASAPEQFRIPMLWIGGALNVRDTVIHRIGSQSDLPETLLAQIGIDRTSFRLSKDFLAPGARQFAYYAFRDGFGYVDPGGRYVFDNVAKSVIYTSGRTSLASIRAGRAYQQVITQAYRNLAAPRAH